MAALPRAAEAAIVRGMGAFMQVSRKTDLPASLRPLQGKHQRLLMARRAVVLDALEDDGLRVLVLHWLEGAPSGIDKRDRAALVIAATRTDGWEEKLAETFGERDPRPAPRAAGRDDLEREKQRSRRAREEAKRAREEAKRDVTEAQRANKKLQDEVHELSARVASMQDELEDLRKTSAKVAASSERELRKTRKEADRARADLEVAQATVRELKQQLSQATAPALKAQTKPRAAKKKVPPPPEPARRAKLAVPKGRFADAPETLAEWLGTPKVHLLVDGYNVSKAEGGFGDLRLERQRDLLLQAVEKVVRRHRITATVVFDGSDIPPGASRRARGPVQVEYSRPDEIADDHLIAKLEGLPKYPVIVATNDRELQRRAARLGATIATSNQLLGLIR